MKQYFTILFLGYVITTQAQQTDCYLMRSIDFDSPSYHNDSRYTPLFGEGDTDVHRVQGIKRFGLLTLGPHTINQAVDYAREEVVYYVLKGAGSLLLSDGKLSIAEDDFFYVPANTLHQFATSTAWLKLIVMGYRLPENIAIETSEVQIANAQKVKAQTLEQLNHGATSRFQLLLGTTQSKRDRLAVAHQINSLFIIDFDPEGTNVPHRHPKEEEIYLVLQGEGEMVVGETENGQPHKVPAKAGDAFYYSRNCLVGFYGRTEKGAPHARILAIRSKYPPED